MARRGEEHQMERMDRVTGLPNRTELTARMQALLDAGRPVTIILVAIDGLRKINDDFGLGAGDSVLRSLAIRFPAFAPEAAWLARPEGARFAVVVPDSGDPLHAARVAAELLELANRPSSVGDHVVRLSAAAGAAIGPSHADTADELIANAKLALQSVADEAGAIRLFEPAMRAAVTARSAMNAEIMHAVEGMELELHFQPQLDLASGAILGAEALLRWNHSERGQLAPPAFLSALEAHSLAPEVGDWILDEACRQLALWRRTHLPAARVSVNLFAGQLRAGNLLEVVRATLRRHDLPAESLELEMAEASVLGGGSRVDQQLAALRQAKVRLALDNFGAGHASLNLIKRLPIHTVKIDRSLVGNLLRDKFGAAATIATLDICRTLGLDVVAGGIETPRQQARLIELGCRFGQGYHLAKPLAPKRFMQYCARRQRLAEAA